MNIELSPRAAKYLARLDNPLKDRIKSALHNLAQEPPQGDIKALAGRDGYRLRVGDYRLLFDILDGSIIVYEIGLRGQIYKGGR